MTIWRTKAISPEVDGGRSGAHIHGVRNFRNFGLGSAGPLTSIKNGLPLKVFIYGTRLIVVHTGHPNYRGFDLPLHPAPNKRTEEEKE